MSRYEGYKPIADYGFIGNRYSAALIDREGSMDWLCMPRFDSPSLFAKILDPDKGGYWSIAPSIPFESTHRYLENTNVLETTFTTYTGKAVLLDFGELDDRMETEHHSIPGRYIRIVRAIEGEMKFRCECAPRPEYGTRMPRFKIDGNDVLFDLFCLTGPGPWKIDEKKAAAVCELDLRAGDQAPFSLRVGGMPQPVWSPPEEALRMTSDYWEEASSRCSYHGPYRDAVVRSTLAIALLSYLPSGAIIAAPTTSLPEELGGERNWDYRFTWLRDSSYTLYAVMSAGLGGTEHEVPLIRWVGNTISGSGKEVRILYPITPGGSTEEKVLDHLRGYCDSRPVRIGNGAVEQVQLDVFGEMALTMRLAVTMGALNPVIGWYKARNLTDWIADNWREPDAGLWESRGGLKHFVYGKAMLWGALKSAVEAVERWDLDADVERWRREMEAIREEIMTKGWSEKLGAFKQSYEDEVLDASNLMLSFIGIVDGKDPKMTSTIDATMKHLVRDGLCYRYDTEKFDDGLKGKEASFILCTFWLVEALARAGRIEEAKEIYDGIMARATPLGLFAEELDPETGKHIGNFPQAFSQLGVIGGAVALAQYGKIGSVEEGVPTKLTAGHREEPKEKESKVEIVVR